MNGRQERLHPMATLLTTGELVAGASHAVCLAPDTNPRSSSFRKSSELRHNLRDIQIGARLSF